MHDMKLTEVEHKDFCTPKPIEKPRYPHGLKVYLGPEEISKLNFQSMPDVDKDMVMMAKVKVVSVNVDENGKNSLELQIMEMALKSKEDEVEEYKAPEKIMYGES